MVLGITPNTMFVYSLKNPLTRVFLYLTISLLTASETGWEIFLRGI